jgi:hypothetical protein
MARRSPRPALVQLEARDLPTFYGNQVFPLDNPWNQKITGAPVSTDSAAVIGRIVARGNARVHPDFGNPVTDGALYGIPVNVVDSSVPKVPVLISPNGWADESDPVMVPIPANAVIEGDGPTGPAPPSSRGDSHLLVYDKSANVLYELGSAARPSETSYPYGGTKPLGTWGAYQLSFWDLNKDSFRTLGWTSADAAGLPIMPGLVRPDEALPPSQGGQGVITHAIRFTVSQTRDEYVYPASHFAGSGTANDLPRMGERFRLRASFQIPATWPAETRAVAQAMKDYGLIVADNGSDMMFQGTPSDQWDMGNMLLIQSALHASDFEVVDLTPVVTGLSVAVGYPGGGTAVVISGQDFSGAAGNLHVLFGGVEAIAFTVLSDSQILAYAPAHAVGTVDVQVQSGSVQNDSNSGPVFFGYGTSAVTPADQFTFSDGAPVPPPIPPPPPPGPPVVPPPPGGRSPGLVGFPQFAVGADVGSSVVRFFNPDGSERFAVDAFPGFTGGVRTAAADFNGDGVADLVVGTGPGGPTHVKVLDGVTQAVLFAVAPFEPSFTGGVFVAAGDLNGDGRADLVITPDQGGGPRVRVFNGVGFGLIADFFGIADPSFRGGARAAVGDVNGDGFGDLIVAAGFGGGPRVAGFDGRSLAAGAVVNLFPDFFAFELGLRNGVYVAAGDLDGDGYAEVIAGGGPGGGPRVCALNGRTLAAGGGPVPEADFFAGDVNNRGGVRVAVKDLNGDGRADLVTGAGAGAGSRVTAYASGSPPELYSFDAFPGFGGGVFVG